MYFSKHHLLKFYEIMLKTIDISFSGKQIKNVSAYNLKFKSNFRGGNNSVLIHFSSLR